MDKCIICSKPLNFFDYTENSFDCPSCGSYVLETIVYKLLTGSSSKSKYDITKLKDCLLRYLSEHGKTSRARIYIFWDNVNDRKCSNGIILDEIYKLYD